VTTTGHLIVGLIEATDVDDLLLASDELLDALQGHPEVIRAKVALSIENKQIAAEVTLRDLSLTGLKEMIEAQCPTIAKSGSASGGEFVSETERTYLPGEDVPMHDPVVVTDGGPWALHDMACSVCRTHKAVLDLTAGTFHPCSQCEESGWELRRRRWH